MKPRLLANENFPQPSVILLRDAGYDVFAIADSHKSVNDMEVMSIAIAEARWILTFDRDYGDLIFSRNFPVPPALIYLRLHSYRPEEPGRLLLDLLREPSNLAGQFVVVQDESLRKRPLPQR